MKVLLLEHLEATVGLLIGLVSILLNREERERNGDWLVHGAVRTHIYRKFTILYGHGSWHPKTITIVTSKITDHRNKYNNEESLKYYKNYQNVTKT